MSSFVKQSGGRILYVDNEGQSHGFSPKSSILPHHDSDSLIVITSTDSIQNPTFTGINIEWSTVTIPIVPTSRNELIEYLNNYTFTESANLVINGRSPGTLFGDDIRVTRRVPVQSAMWSHGLPLHAVDTEVVGSGRWYVEPDVVTPSFFDGVSSFETGTDANGKIFVTSSRLNRYQPGQLSYFVFTAAFENLSNANGNFLLLFGGMLRGLASDGQFGQIKDGIVIGFKRDNGDFHHVMRVYKNFQFTEEIFPFEETELQNLKILRLEIGYLGIHPASVNKVNFNEQKDEVEHTIIFNQDITSVSNPNLAIGIYVENQGNTSNLMVKNGSLQFGNYAERPAPDPSARNLFDSFESVSISSGADTVLAVYTLPEKLTMYKEINSGGTLTGTFRNAIANKLNTIQAKGTANKFITLNVYLVPKADVVATFTPLNPNINALERAVGVAITSVSLANAIRIGALNDVVVGGFADVSSQDILLTPDLVGVITVSCSQNITDFTYIISTSDLF